MTNKNKPSDNLDTNKNITTDAISEDNTSKNNRKDGTTTIDNLSDNNNNSNKPPHNNGSDESFPNILFGLLIGALFIVLLIIAVMHEDISQSTLNEVYDFQINANLIDVNDLNLLKDTDITQLIEILNTNYTSVSDESIKLYTSFLKEKAESIKLEDIYDPIDFILDKFIFTIGITLISSLLTKFEFLKPKQFIILIGTSLSLIIAVAFIKTSNINNAKKNKDQIYKFHSDAIIYLMNKKDNQGKYENPHKAINIYINPLMEELG